VRGEGGAGRSRLQPRPQPRLQSLLPGLRAWWLGCVAGRGGGRRLQLREAARQGPATGDLSCPCPLIPPPRPPDGARGGGQAGPGDPAGGPGGGGCGRGQAAGQTPPRHGLLRPTPRPALALTPTLTSPPHPLTHSSPHLQSTPPVLLPPRLLGPPVLLRLRDPGRRQGGARVQVKRWSNPGRPAVYLSVSQPDCFSTPATATPPPLPNPHPAHTPLTPGVSQGARCAARQAARR
jgi:hypothetical protein